MKRTLVKAQARLVEATFRQAKLRAMLPGNRRLWFVPVIKKALRCYRRLAREGSGSDPRECFHRLLNNLPLDRRMKSRWSKALRLAVEREVPVVRMPGWLRRGGGVYGRSRSKIS